MKQGMPWHAPTFIMLVCRVTPWRDHAKSTYTTQKNKYYTNSVIIYKKRIFASIL
jgi:hypothetical protein